MATFVKEYDWMWLPSGLNLSPAECRVYAYIYGLTESKHSKTKGYNGSVRQLAKDLGLSLGKTSGALKKLQEENRITLTEGIYQSVQIMNDSVHLVNGSVQKTNDNIQSVNESVQSVNSPLTTPLYKEIDKEMERGNTIARDTIATQDPKPFDLFNEFLSAYGASRKDGGLQQGNLNQMAQNLRECRQLWNAKTPTEQRLLLRAIKEGKWSKPRLDWTISDFQAPVPTNYNGSPDLNRMAENNDMVVALYNGIAGIYTKQDAEDYGMDIKRPFKL